jgi:hypothetical protein
MICTPHPIFFGDRIEKNEMGGSGSTYGGQERRIQGFWWRILSKRDHLGDPGVDGWIILRCIFKKGVWKYGMDRAGSG